MQFFVASQLTIRGRITVKGLEAVVRGASGQSVRRQENYRRMSSGSGGYIL